MQKLTGPTARQNAYDRLRDLVLTDPSVQGTFLNEGDLVDKFGLSRTPIREALIMLASDGLVELITHRGAYVRPSDDRAIRETMEMRTLIELEAARQVLASDRVPLETMSDLLEQQANLEVSSETVPDFISIDQRFHAAMVDAPGNRVMSDFYTRLRVMHVRFGISATWTSSQRPAEVLDEHTRILEALRAGDATETEAAIRHHIERTQCLLLHETPMP
ncbi:GntR family transcriptional regulator [Rothia sp. HC945]|jgi:DNA-binding GntR family transcriptional regulator|uniref:GntR family transcriptional regulator n=1 Tax=Rothia sp. HC945 TaxID=3171170 RepID=UPI00264C4261|nr:GntR family transcriptional regulator [Kocuria sp.]MDN5617188.1 GntR family transcriptional regulator [Kocuria sp.]MDN5653684.1 GntR family transcriptional regulator [Kocuria sp.]